MLSQTENLIEIGLLPVEFLTVTLTFSKKRKNNSIDKNKQEIKVSGSFEWGFWYLLDRNK